jgi:hypothetical protein
MTTAVPEAAACRGSGYYLTVPIAASTVVTVLFVVVVLLGLLAAPAFRRTGDSAERMTPLGSGARRCRRVTSSAPETRAASGTSL